MKRTLRCVLACLMSASLAACGGSASAPAESAGASDSNSTETEETAETEETEPDAESTAIAIAPPVGSIDETPFDQTDSETLDGFDLKYYVDEEGFRNYYASQDLYEKLCDATWDLRSQSYDYYNSIHWDEYSSQSRYPYAVKMSVSDGWIMLDDGSDSANGDQTMMTGTDMPDPHITVSGFPVQNGIYDAFARIVDDVLNASIECSELEEGTYSFSNVKEMTAPDGRVWYVSDCIKPGSVYAVEEDVYAGTMLDDYFWASIHISATSHTEFEEYQNSEAITTEKLFDILGHITFEENPLN